MECFFDFFIRLLADYQEIKILGFHALSLTFRERGMVPICFIVWPVAVVMRLNG
jgi:hypothetical protein